MSIFRSLLRSPGFLTGAVLTLALGIGINVACFGVIRAVLLKPLAYRNPGRIVLISSGAIPVNVRFLFHRVRPMEENWWAADRILRLGKLADIKHLKKR